MMVPDFINFVFLPDMDPYFDKVTPATLTPYQLDVVLSRGWYRMRQEIFTITHLAEEFGYYKVHWIRFDVDRILLRSSHKRILKNHRNCRVTIEPLVAVTDQQRALHRKYRNWIDFDGVRNIDECLYGEKRDPGKNIFSTNVISVFEGEDLIACGYFDSGKESAASILHFFDPDRAHLSPGKFLILKTIEYMQSLGMRWYYPGYVIAGKPKMDYKLFLGKDLAEYYDQKDGMWKPFEDIILTVEPIIIFMEDDFEEDETGENPERIE